MTQWKAGGYVIRQYLNDHDPKHVHVFLDGVLIARVCVPSGEFHTLEAPRHAGRILAALRNSRLID